MSFWDSYKVIRTEKRFQPVKRDPLPPLTIQPSIATSADVPDLTTFLTTYFGDAHHPVLKPVLKPSNQELILYLKKGTDIQATIRYKYAGIFEGQSIYLIDCFCAKERKTGLARHLMTSVHLQTDRIPNALFLKEGRPISGQDPLYSSYYMYRRRRSIPESCFSITTQQAYALVNTYRRIHKDMFWISECRNPNQHWRLWKRGQLWSLACFQDSFQRIGKETIGWMTAFIGNTAAGLETLVDHCPFPWIWADRCWITEPGKWLVDGPFHWYTYRWTTSLMPGAGLALRCYGIVV